MDGKVTSVGTGGVRGTRNAPSLLDASMVSSFFWDGRETRLEDVVAQPFTNPVEMGLASEDALLSEIQDRPDYVEAFEEAFGDRTVRIDHIERALAAYVRSQPVPPTRYDLSLQSASGIKLSESEQAGLTLFNGKAACADCHQLSGTPTMLTDHLFHHTGIGFERVAGNVTGMVKRLDSLKQAGRPVGQAILVDAEIAELGRFASTRRPADLGAFRTPSLRNVNRTAPYMHDGSVPTLQAAVEREIYYRSLARGRPISLTVEEQSQLMAFLSTLDAPYTASSARPTPQENGRGAQRKDHLQAGR